MDYSQLSAAVESVLGTVSYDPPVGLEYCRQVRDALLIEAPGISAEVFIMHQEVTVHVEQGLAVYELTLPLE